LPGVRPPSARRDREHGALSYVAAAEEKRRRRRRCADSQPPEIYCGKMLPPLAKMNTEEK